jgi:hypothetical protein
MTAIEQSMRHNPPTSNLFFLVGKERKLRALFFKYRVFTIAALLAMVSATAWAKCDYKAYRKCESACKTPACRSACGDMITTCTELPK